MLSTSLPQPGLQGTSHWGAGTSAIEHTGLCSPSAPRALLHLSLCRHSARAAVAGPSLQPSLPACGSLRAIQNSPRLAGTQVQPGLV